MNGRRIGLAAAWLLLAATVPAQPPPAEPPATHHQCLEQERQAIARGEGFGMALPADRNGFPGPTHILELRQELELSQTQERQVQQLFDRMHEQAVAAGQKLLEKEAELERAFASGSPDAQGVKRLLQESVALRADLRWVHLSAHREAYSLLSAEQRARYHALRYGSHEPPH